MTREELIKQIFTKKTFLCVGIDTDIKKIPQHMIGGQDPILALKQQLIDATEKYYVAYNKHLAFYESMGLPF